MIDMLSKRAPSIVVFTLCAALLAQWIEAPVWLPKLLAIAVGGLALLLFASRVRRHEFRRQDESGTERSWFDYELAGKGTPPGYYILAFFGFVTIVLTGFQSAYAMPAWAAFALGIVWGLANRSYPLEEDGDA
jgi:hypothetical protein